MTEHLDGRKVNHHTDKAVGTGRGNPIPDISSRQQTNTFCSLVAAGILNRMPAPRPADAESISVFTGSCNDLDTFIHGTDQDEVW